MNVSRMKVCQDFIIVFVIILTFQIPVGLNKTNEMLKIKPCQIVTQPIKPVEISTPGKADELINDIFICGEVKKLTGFNVGVDKTVCQRCTPETIKILCKETIEYHKNKKEFPYQQLTKIEMGKNFFGALKRLGQDRAAAVGLALRGDFSKLSYKVAKRTYIERQMCCPTCRATNKCPYCGCYLTGERFSKSVLCSEIGCPNPTTYPNLRRYPPRNYWQVCNEKTTIIIPARDEPYLNRTLQSLLENATGRIEIIVILDGCDYEVMKHSLIKVIRHKEPQGRRHSINEAAEQARGQYLFHIDAHCTMDEGYDTKLKCACDDRAIAVSVIRPLDPKTWKLVEDNAAGTFAVHDKNFAEIWSPNSKPLRSCKVMEPTLTFIGLAWMIKKNYFWQLGGYDVSLGKYGYDGPEWSLKVWLHEKYPGKVLLRTDVVCGHVFHRHKGTEFTSDAKVSGMPAEAWRDEVLQRWGNRSYELIEKFVRVKAEI